MLLGTRRCARRSQSRRMGPAQFNWTKKWQTNIAYGIDQPDDSELAVGSRSRNQQYMTNVIDRMTRNISFSLFRIPPHIDGLP